MFNVNVPSGKYAENLLLLKKPSIQNHKLPVIKNLCKLPKRSVILSRPNFCR